MIVHNAFADTVTTSVPVGNNPDGIGINPNTNMIYVTNHNDNTTSVIDGSTNTVVKTISVGYALVTVNPTTNEIYVDAGKNDVAVINGSTGNIITTIAIPVGNGAVNIMTNKIYEGGCCGKDVISVIDGSTNAVTSTIPVETELSGLVAVNSKTNMIYATTICVGCGQNTSVLVIDGNTNSVVTNIPLPFVWQSLDVNPNTDMIYAAAGSNVYVINGATNQITATINGVIGGMPAIAVNPNTNKIYVADSRNNVVNIIDGATNSIENKIPGFNVPDAIRVNPNTNMVYVANGGNNTVSVLDGNNFKITSALTVNSQDSFGNTLPGYYTELYATNGTQIDAGYTTYNFTLDNGQNYTVRAEDYGKYVFDHWLDTGSTIDNRTMSITSNDSITAVYKTVPQPPTNLAAAAVSSSQINLSWNAPTNDGGSSVTSYEIKRSTDDSTWSVLVKNPGSTGTTYSDTGLSPNSTYYYRVFAINDVGISLRSNTASATTPILTVAGTNVGPVTTVVP